MNLKLNEICSPHGPHEPLLSKLIGSMKYEKQIGPKFCSIHYNPTVCITISLKLKFYRNILIGMKKQEKCSFLGPPREIFLRH